MHAGGCQADFRVGRAFSEPSGVTSALHGTELGAGIGAVMGGGWSARAVPHDPKGTLPVSLGRRHHHLGVVLLTVFLADRHFGLFIGASAGFQGAGYMILMRHLRKARVGQ